MTINVQPFELEEHGVVRRVGRIAAKDSTWRDDAKRRALALQRLNLNSRSLRPPRRNIERIEVIEARFNLRAVFDGITHRNENVFDLLAD